MTLFEFKKRFLPTIVRTGIGLGLGIFVILITQDYLFEVGLLKEIDLLTVNYRFQSRGPLSERNVKETGDVVIVSIDDEDLKAMPERFPFPHSYYAHLAENLIRAGARVVAFDITFEPPREPDSAFVAVMGRYDNIVLAAKVQTGAVSEQYEVRSLEQNYNNIYFGVNKQIGIVNIVKDRDDVCREYVPMVTIGDRLTPTFAFAVLNRAYKLPALTRVGIDDQYFRFTPLRRAGMDDEQSKLRVRLIPRYSPTTFMLNYYGPNKTFRYVSFSQVIDDSSFKTKDEIENEVDLDAFDASTAELFKGKIVVVGSTMAEERDYHNTPFYSEDGGKRNHSMNGVEIHATAIQNVIDGSFITRMKSGTESMILLILSLGGFFGFLGLKRLRVKRAGLLEIGLFILVVLLIGGIFEIGVLIFSASNVMMSVVNPSVALVFAYVGAAVYQYLIERQQKAVIKNVFSHYINPAVVNELIANPEKAKLGGDRRELTVFFSDIQGFTTIAEQFHDRPDKLVEILNEYLDEMTAIVLKYQGTLDKYEGDAIMAFWGAPIAQKDHALRCINAALEMQNRLTVLRAKWKKEGRPPLVVRCGINTGVMIVGNIGGKERFDYTVIGDSVNLASRLEGANKQYNSHIMISDMTYQHVKNNVTVRELDMIQVKGKTEPVKVYEVLGRGDMDLTEQQTQALEMYHEGIRLYRNRQWDEAIAYMQQVLKIDPTFYVAQLYSERAGLYRVAPPPSEWKGVFVMQTK
jgi:adenylate cyclase